MSSGLQARLERLQETVNPEPPTMTTIIVVRYVPDDGPGRDDGPLFRIGRFADVFFLGGSEQERKKALRRLRASGKYDVLPAVEARGMIGEGDSGEAEGTEATTGVNGRRSDGRR